MISGHRDAVYTRCPGNAAYSLMTALRRDADAAMRASPSANLESVTTGFNSLSVTQLAADPETSGPVYVWASFVGDRGPAFGDRERSDVAVAFPGLGSQHGFRATFTVPLGLGRSVSMPSMSMPAGTGSSAAAGWPSPQTRWATSSRSRTGTGRSSRRAAG